MSEHGEDLRASFAYSGRVDARAFVVLPFFLALAFAAGLLYQALLDAHGWLLLNVFVPPLLGGAAGILGLAALRAGHVRHPGLARALVIAVVLFALFSAWLCALGLLESGFAGLGEAWDRKWTFGDPVPGRADPAPPGLLLVGVLFETLIVLWLGVGLPLVWWRRAVYSEELGAFVPSETLPRRYHPSPAQLYQRYQEGGLEALRASELHVLPEEPDEGALHGRLYRAPEGLWLNLEWRGKLPDARGRKSPRSVLVLRRIAVDEAFLERCFGLGER